MYRLRKIAWWALVVALSGVVVSLLPRNTCSGSVACYFVESRLAYSVSSGKNKDVMNVIRARFSHYTDLDLISDLSSGATSVVFRSEAKCECITVSITNALRAHGVVFVSIASEELDTEFWIRNGELKLQKASLQVSQL
jgi:hypothetical protein